MDPLLARKPQDVERLPDDDGPPVADAATGPHDRWANEAARGDADYPAASPEGALGDEDAAAVDINADLEDDGRLDESAGTDPAIHGQAR